MPRLLTSEEINRQVKNLPDWRFETNRIQGSFELPTFPAAIAVVTEVADEAEQMNHHPDIDIRWRKLAFTLSTHSAKGVTQLDIELAHRISGIVAQHSS